MLSPDVSIDRSPVSMPPLVTLAEIVAFASRGIRIVRPPFTKSSLTPPSGTFAMSMSRPAVSFATAYSVSRVGVPLQSAAAQIARLRVPWPASW